MPVLVVLFICLIFLTYAEVKEKTINEFNLQQLTLARQATPGIDELSSKIREVLD